MVWRMGSFGNRAFRRSGLLLIMSAIVLFGAGCSSFNREWRKAGRNTVTLDGLEGRWEGRWVSEVNGHHGKLRCIVKKQEDVYKARFRAKYRKILTFGYTVPLKAEPVENGYKFRGEADLGALAGGVYHYDGHTDGSNFLSTYSCKYDHGTFQMQRR